MIIDASAVIAIIQNEPQTAEIVATLADIDRVRIGAPTATECLIVLSHRHGPASRAIFERVRQEFNIGTADFTAEHIGAAQRAYLEFGKGRHRAALNFGDCMAYAVARVADEPLLCVGDDFAQTDLVFDGVVGRWPSAQ